MLGALGQAVAVRVPAAVDPGELDGPAAGRPQLRQPRVVAGQLPFPVELDHAAELPVGRHLAELAGPVQRQAAREATQHLIGQGCRRVGIIAGPAQITTGATRLAGYRAALRAADRDNDQTLTAYGNFRTDGGYAAARKLLQRPQPPDGLLISNDLMTIGALQAIAEAGLSIPDDIAVVGFDNASWATAFRPPLTVVTQPTYEIGEVATDLLLRRVSGEQFPPHHVVLRAKLVERESSRRLPPG